ncbi:hypothetical protein SSS_00956 [Sarcoptes scabiei]|nr:hypothetical protein SSS_00956 [Sarcoptes scabiei]
MSESEIVNTNNNSTDEIVTKDPKNESLKRKENEVRIIQTRSWTQQMMKAIIRKLNMKTAPMKNLMTQMTPVSGDVEDEEDEEDDEVIPEDYEDEEEGEGADEDDDDDEEDQ